MDYLALCKKLCRDSGTLAEAAFVSVVGQTGRANKVANWINDAWLNIQNSRYGWRWMRQEYVAQLTMGQVGYGYGDLGLTRWAEWGKDTSYICVMSLWDPALDRADEHPIAEVPYWYFFDRYMRGVMPRGRPIEWSIADDGQLMFAPSPDKPYLIHHLYVKEPQVLVNNTDVPELPPRFHEIIVLEAWRLLMIADGAYGEGEYIGLEFARMRNELERDQLPPVVFTDSAVA